MEQEKNIHERVAFGILKTGFMLNGCRRYYFMPDRVRRYYFSNSGNLFPFDICYDPQYRQPDMAYPQKNLSMHFFILTPQLLL